jgi:peptidoglycan hydrolase-like protein with peptidoglycan-binding domain
MRKLILATVSALALGMAGAGIGHAAEPASPEPAPQGVQTQPGARTQVEHGAQAENWSKSRIEQVQQQLKTAGAYNGPINGELNAQTQQAISQFQQEHGLRKTGSLDQQTLATLDNVSNSGGNGATAPSNQGR